MSPKQIAQAILASTGGRCDDTDDCTAKEPCISCAASMFLAALKVDGEQASCGLAAKLFRKSVIMELEWLR